MTTTTTPTAAPTPAPSPTGQHDLDPSRHAPTGVGTLEHANLTVRDPDRTAALLGRIFGWTVRWRGESIHGGTTVHVGAADNYLALYTPPPTTVTERVTSDGTYRVVNGLNHLGVVVDDLDAAEARVLDAGLAPFNHADYAPGRRFYFLDDDGVEYEVVSYR